MKRTGNRSFCKGFLLAVLLLIGVFSVSVALGSEDLSEMVTSEVVQPMASSGNSTGGWGETVEIDRYGTVLEARGDYLILKLAFYTESFEKDLRVSASAVPQNASGNPFFYCEEQKTLTSGQYRPGMVTLKLVPDTGTQLTDYEEDWLFYVYVSFQGTSKETGEWGDASDSGYFQLKSSYIDIGDVSLFSADNQYLGLDISWSGKWDAEAGTDVYFPLQSNGTNMSLSIPEGKAKLGNAQEDSFSGMGSFPYLSSLEDPLYVGVQFHDKPKIGEERGRFLFDYKKVNVSDIHALETVEIPENVAVLGEESLAGIAAECVIIPEDTQTVEINAFRGCENLKALIVKGANTVIPKEALSECNQLRTIIVNQNNQVVKTLGDSLGLVVSDLGW